jgi:hypothetical protein
MKVAAILGFEKEARDVKANMHLVRGVSLSF